MRLKNIQVLKNITDRSNKIKEDKGKSDKKFSVCSWMRNILRERFWVKLAKFQ